MAEWTSNHDYATRVNNLTDTGSGLLSRLNANYFLIQDQTVFNDSSTDTLTGSAGMDWFFAGNADKITDLSAADQAFICSLMRWQASATVCGGLRRNDSSRES